MNNNYNPNLLIDFDGEMLLFSNPDVRCENNIDSLQHKLIHSNDPLTRIERMRISGVIDSYYQITLRETNLTRNKKCNAIKKVINESK